METAQLCPPEIRSAIASLRAALEDSGKVPPDELARAVESGEVIGALTDDAELACAVAARPAIRHEGLTAEGLARLIGPAGARTAQDLLKLGDLGLPRDWSPARGLDARQAETLRQMLLAVVSDPRLMLARLAEQLVLLRHSRALSDEERERVAVEARVVFAPLANRLGVWQLKWELEDLAFRYLEPEEYRHIAAALNEKRADRERYIDAFCDDLRDELERAGVVAEVKGRPKHIYSIHKKMQRKHVEFDQIFDVRAVRIVCATIPDCYAALGVVHGHWPYISGEFDDYIATPKDNHYRSIHTAVVGPESRSVEVQIRTHEMHEHAELGVAAHWQYKEGGPRNAQYERKIEAVRRMLAPKESVDAEERDFIERIRTTIFEDRVYALTPKGEVVDLPSKATPLDFAYHVHTDLGHRCRGAKVNGRIVPLTYALSNGEIVDIIAGKHPAPSRDWLAPEQGYLVSGRNRAKVRAWFRKQNAGDNRGAGRSIAERELTRLAAGPEIFSALVQELKANDADHLYQLLGEGEITTTQFAQAAERLARPAPPPPAVRRKPATSSARKRAPVEIEGVGDLPTTLARCCAPIRPRPITGYVAIGRGVTIHRSDCRSLARMAALKPDRILKVEWTRGETDPLSVEIAVSAQDRRGLVRDLTDILALERLSIETLNTTTDRDQGTARVTVRVAVRDDEQLGRLLHRFSSVPSVMSARRTH